MESTAKPAQEARLNEKLEEFTRSIGSYKPVVFCVKCGSTTPDQNAIYKLA